MASNGWVSRPLRSGADPRSGQTCIGIQRHLELRAGDFALHLTVSFPGGVDCRLEVEGQKVDGGMLEVECSARIKIRGMWAWQGT
ncbi:predicted protein [Chaetomium globosum CBS 148.51]|uniref:Uncharacterized protein n=1 Tax=Chaetomium globosum (strain ATCC 6205 / CBS 148.51 / DSM 1962 / NBRC 6347 / NRRL 1970) TaxID=306901 RepID=Q2H2G5_CHAGB|nr:uncharacterized protein CHGG_04031 [Chaetomium globosum CBS 148.51]EAQ87412.1 predicted protein [Chaetomium globosum CBS 148.51]